MLACLNGEVDVVTSGLHEYLSLLKAGQLRNLCVCSNNDMKIDGIVLKAANNWVP